tara:strand:- start:180 stop:845 length:666 start_codon:yes stop_codon:yes gene_type:complete
MKKVLLIIIASLFSFSAANSEVTLGVSGNYSVFAAEGKEENYGYAGALSKTTVEYGAFTDQYVSIFGEFSPNGVVGIGIEYVPTTISTPKNINTQVQGTDGTSSDDTVQADFVDLTTLYAIARLPIAGMYVKAGMSVVDIEINETGKSGSYNNTDTDGYMIAIGSQFNMDNGIGVRVELKGHQFDDVTANNGTAAGSADANVVTVTDQIGATGTISLVKTF